MNPNQRPTTSGGRIRFAAVELFMRGRITEPWVRTVLWITVVVVLVALTLAVPDWRQQIFGSLLNGN